VHEIDEEGNVVQLSDTETCPPNPLTLQHISSSEEERIQALASIFDQSFAEEIENLSKKSGKGISIHFSLPQSITKEERTKMHHSIKKFYLNLATSTQKEENGDQKFQVRLLGENRGNMKRLESRNWPKDHPDYLSFVLHKMDRNGNRAIANIAHFVG